MLWPAVENSCQRALHCHLPEVLAKPGWMSGILTHERYDAEGLLAGILARLQVIPDSLTGSDQVPSCLLAELHLLGHFHAHHMVPSSLGHALHADVEHKALPKLDLPGLPEAARWLAAQALAHGLDPVHAPGADKAPCDCQHRPSADLASNSEAPQDRLAAPADLS